MLCAMPLGSNMKLPSQILKVAGFVELPFPLDVLWR